MIVEKYLWQGMTRLLAVYDGNNNLLMRFGYADARMPFAMTMGGALYYLAYDQVGSLRVVADGSGNAVKKIDYDSFGNIFNDSAPGFAVPFGFAGGLYDKDTKLVRFGYRDYDPDTGRWTAKDPIGFRGGDSDLYGYCVGDPINWIDPWGLADCSAKQNNFLKDLLPLVTEVADKYNFDPNFLLGLSAHESGWLGKHGRELNNAFGSTHGGGKNLSFGSIRESVQWWGETYGSKVRGSGSIDEFVNRLQTDERDQGGLGKYNSLNPEGWKTLIKNAYKSVVNRRGVCPCEK